MKTTNGHHEIDLSQFPLHTPKPRNFDENKHYLFFADDYQKFQFGSDPYASLHKNKKLGQKTTHAPGYNWLEQAYPQLATCKTQSKEFLFKVIEYNKVELIESDTSLQQNSPFEEELEWQLLQSKQLEPQHKEQFRA